MCALTYLHYMDLSVVVVVAYIRVMYKNCIVNSSRIINVLFIATEYQLKKAIFYKIVLLSKCNGNGTEGECATLAQFTLTLLS